jgi:hypothetical protein
LATSTGYRGTTVLGGEWLRISADTKNLVPRAALEVDRGGQWLR